MEIVGVFLNAFIVITALISGWLLKNYFPSYMGEKGKNLAMKEDIQAITEKIESVKAEYTKSLEEIKARI